MSLIFLGVDPGSRATGYGLVAADGDQVLSYRQRLYFPVAATAPQPAPGQDLPASRGAD